MVSLGAVVVMDRKMKVNDGDGEKESEHWDVWTGELRATKKKRMKQS